MNNRQLFYLFVVALGLIILISGTIYSTIEYNGMAGTTKEVATNCYDRFQHKIDGLTCSKKVIDEYDDLLIAANTMAVILLSLGMAGLMKEYDMKNGGGR